MALPIVDLAVSRPDELVTRPDAHPRVMKPSFSPQLPHNLFFKIRLCLFVRFSLCFSRDFDYFYYFLHLSSHSRYSLLLFVLLKVLMLF
jgi:hypothetical protein